MHQFLRRLKQTIATVDSKLRIIAFAILFVVLSSFMTTMVEPGTFPTFFDALWWVMTTVTTVGYGDVSPVTEAGKSFAMILYILGIGFIGLAIGIITDMVLAFKKKKEEGKLAFKNKDHSILINITHRSKKTLLELLKLHPDNEFVVIDDNHDKIPFNYDRVHFVKGDPSDEATLLKANILKSKNVLIFASDEAKQSQIADGQTLLIATSVEGLSEKENIDIHTIAEVMDEKNVKNFKHAGVDEFTTPNQTASHLIAKASSVRGSGDVFRQLSSCQYGDDLYEIKAHPSWDSYQDAAHYLFSKGATLLSNGKELGIARKHNETIPKNATLLIISNKETYLAIKEELQSKN